MEKTVFGFDMGKTSIGYCVRKGHDIKTANSLIINKDHGEKSTSRNRRRIKRTLDSHKAREKFLDEIWTKCNLDLIDKNSFEFKKEFSSKNENEIYTSCLLRISLLQNKPLKIWQIYKALHNAIQRRGYDPDLPWKSLQTDDDKENLELVKKYTQENGVEIISNDEYKFPCYYDALRLGLWEENNPETFKNTVSGEKVRTTKYVASRALVENELILLWENAQKQIPELKKISTEEFLYGKYREKYGSYTNPDYRKTMGTNEDLQGVLGQKIPRFNNRIISKCKLLPKRNVCKAETIENVSLVLLMKLKNLRLTDISGEKIILSPDEIRKIYEKWHSKMEKNNKLDVTITKSDIQEVIERKIIDKIDPMKAKISGRSSFCRRACLIMIKEILTGELDPLQLDISEFVDKEGTKNGIFEDEIREMLSKIGDWNNLYIPDNRYEDSNFEDDIRKKTDETIGDITNPIVRNRLQIFRDLLINLKKEYGTPNEIIFEFARGDNSFDGAKKAKKYELEIKNNEKNNEKIKEKLKEIGALDSSNFEKLKLLEKQGGRCIYSGRPISISDFSACEIDHIYPRSRGGCDAFYNKVLCYREENQNKKDKTPYEAFSSNKDFWAEYTSRLNSIKGNLGSRKFELLTSADCDKLTESYNALAETAYIARIAQKIAADVFNWGLQKEGEKRHIFVNNGFSTYKIRRQYNLNSLLGDDVKKNRENDKHHALDAICISYSRDYKYDSETGKDSIKGFDLNNVKEVIDEIMPYPYTNKKPLKMAINPLETIYGKRVVDGVSHITSRVPIEDIEKTKVPKIIDEAIRNDLFEKIELSKSEWADLLKNYIHPRKKTKVKKVMISVSEGVVEKDNNGRERIGEFADFGCKGTFGQFKHSKSHKGQILYYDKKGKVKVMPLYSNKNTDEIKEELLNSGLKLYKKGMMFYSGCLVKIPNDFMARKNSYPKGTYKLRTIKSNGDVMLENSNGIEIPTRVINLVSANFSKLN